MLTIDIAYTFIYNIFYYFSFVGLSFYFSLFVIDVACSELFDRQKEKGFNLSPSFSLKGGVHCNILVDEDSFY